MIIHGASVSVIDDRGATSLLLMPPAEVGPLQMATIHRDNVIIQLAIGPPAPWTADSGGWASWLRPAATPRVVGHDR